MTVFKNATDKFALHKVKFSKMYHDVKYIKCETLSFCNDVHFQGLQMHFSVLRPLKEIITFPKVDKKFSAIIMV